MFEKLWKLTTCQHGNQSTHLTRLPGCEQKEAVDAAAHEGPCRQGHWTQLSVTILTIKLLMLRKGLLVGAWLFPLGPRSFALSVYIPTGNTCTPFKATSVLASVPPTRGEAFPGSRYSGSPRPAAGAVLEDPVLPEVTRTFLCRGSHLPPCCCGPLGRRQWRRRRCYCSRRRRRSGTLGRSWLFGMGDQTRQRHWPTGRRTRCWSWRRQPRTCPCPPRWGDGRELGWATPWARRWTPTLQTLVQGLSSPPHHSVGSGGRGASPSRTVRPHVVPDRRLSPPAWGRLRGRPAAAGRRHPSRPLRRGAVVREPCPGHLAPGVPGVSEA